MENNKEKSTIPGASYYAEDEITLKELILKIQEFWQEIKRNWKLVLIVTIIFMGIMLVKAILTPVTYPAKLTFMLNDDEGSKGGGAGAILGQFGFGSSGGGVNINKMIELAQSRKIVSMVLFEKIKIEEEEDYIANHIIRAYDFHDKWEDSKTLNGFLFTNDDIVNFSRVENQVLKSLHRQFIKEEDGIMTLSPDGDTGILTLVISSSNEVLSINCSEVFFDKLGTYYIEKTINKQQDTYGMLKQRTDSLEQALNRNQLAVLKFEDSNRSLGLRQYEMQRLMLQGEVQKLEMTYAESFKQLRIAEFALQNKMPFITTIDEPIYPLGRQSESTTKAIILGGFLGVFLVVMFLVGRKVYRDTMI